MGSVYCVAIQSLNPSIVAARRPRSSPNNAVLIATSLTGPLVLDFAARHEVAGDVGKTGASLVVGPAVATVAKKDRKMLPTLGGCRVLSRRAGTRERRTILVDRKTSSLSVLEIKKSPATRAGPSSRQMLSSSLRSRATPLAGLIALRRRAVGAAGAALRRLVGLVHVW